MVVRSGGKRYSIFMLERGIRLSFENIILCGDAEKDLRNLRGCLRAMWNDTYSLAQIRYLKKMGFDYFKTKFAKTH